MKKFLMPLAALALLATACDTESKDSYTTYNFGEYNLIVDNDNPSEPAQVSTAIYTLKMNWSKACVDVQTSDIIINNQKQSFETDTMALYPGFIKDEVANQVFQEMYFSKKGNVGKGATITNMTGRVTGAFYNTNSLTVPDFQTTYSQGTRLIMGYDLNDRYHFQTFWPECYYAGQTHVYDKFGTFSTKNTSYRVKIDFTKKTAQVVIYYPEFSVESKDTPKAILIEDIAVAFSHSSYRLEANDPKTRILANKDGKNEWADPGEYDITNFNLTIVSSDLTEASISYKMPARNVSFAGSSVVKGTK